MVTRRAEISACGRFRWVLTRTWDSMLPLLVFVMLNPSTADAKVDDQTIRKCMEFARRLGDYGGVAVVNLFAYRATKPADLKAAGWPVGEINDAMIDAYCKGQDVICAWGANARAAQAKKRADEVLRRVSSTAKSVRALRLLADGVPEHPCMLPYSCVPVELEEEVLW